MTQRGVDVCSSFPPCACGAHKLRRPAAALQIRDAEEAARGAQNYSTMLQSYNTNLQADVNSEKARRCELERARDTLQAQCAELGGLVKSLEQMLAFEKASGLRIHS